MELMKFIIWLTAGAVVGWFANRVVMREQGWTRKKPELVEGEVSSSEKS